MSVEITPELEGLVQSIFQTGNYPDENAVLGEALRLLEKREKLRREVNAGVEQLDRGEYTEYGEDAMPQFLEDIKMEQGNRFGEESTDK